jgi:hypothetical protein
MEKWFDVKMIMSVAAGIILAGLVVHVVGFLVMVSMGGYGYGHMNKGRMMMERREYVADDAGNYMYGDSGPKEYFYSTEVPGVDDTSDQPVQE